MDAQGVPLNVPINHDAATAISHMPLRREILIPGTFHPSSGATYTILTATGGVTGNFSQVVDTLNTNGLTRTDVIGPNGVLVSNPVDEIFFNLRQL
jgi:hypothetical protein